MDALAVSPCARNLYRPSLEIVRGEYSYVYNDPYYRYVGFYANVYLLSSVSVQLVFRWERCTRFYVLTFRFSIL